ncbi:hypothetical protein [Acrocarpospora corrugata]|nr:hypothetical protein [Acrocarpospora corrugata]
MATHTVRTTSTQFQIVNRDKNPTSVTWSHVERDVRFPVIDLGVTRKKGRVVQFLEQAFEWSRVSYVFYPYFWARRARWIELMDHADDADPAFTGFLRAGMARVLLAATPGYEQAILHYLATREP